MLFIILIAVVLIGTLSAVILKGGDSESSNIDKETLMIRASEVQRFAGEVERGVRFILQNGFSENDLRFAHPDAPSEYGDLSADADPADQIFHRSGGGATYRAVPAGINDGSQWEIYGSSQAPSVGTSAADLMIVLPNVTLDFCATINTLNDQPATEATIPQDTADCVNGGSTERFTGSFTAANTMDETTFSQDSTISEARPATQACVECAADGSYHFYHVLLAR